jgi:hypothetical protein
VTAERNAVRSGGGRDRSRKPSAPERPEAEAAKRCALGARDEVVNAGWRWIQQTEGALTVAAMDEAGLAATLNTALPAETSQIAPAILAVAKILEQWKAKVDAGFDVAAQLAAAPGLAESIQRELAGAEVAKSAPVADTRDIDLLDGKLATWIARLNKTARRAFRDAGDEVKAREYRFHHLKRGASTRPAPSPTPPTP